MVVPLKSMFLITGICEFLLRKNIFADVIKLRLLRQGDKVGPESLEQVSM